MVVNDLGKHHLCQYVQLCKLDPLNVSIAKTSNERKLSLRNFLSPAYKKVTWETSLITNGN